MTRFLLVTVIIIVVVGVGLKFGAGYFQKQPQKYQGPIEKLSVGNVREYSIFNIIAKEKGYFADNGLDVEIKEYESGPPAIKDLLIGKVNVALASDNAGVQNIFISPELRIVSQFVRNKVFSVVARHDKGINMPSDLKGKRVGVTKKSAGEFLFSQFLTLQNLSQADVYIVDLPPSQIKTELQQGNIDAGVLFEPNVFDLINTLGKNAIVWPVENDYSTYGLIYITEDFIKTHPLLIQRYLQSLVEAEKYVIDHPTETKELIGKKFGYSKEYIEYSWTKNNHSLGLSQELLLSMENIADWAIKNKLTAKTIVPNYLDYIYFDALDKVKPEAITIIR